MCLTRNLREVGMFFPVETPPETHSERYYYGSHERWNNPLFSHVLRIGESRRVESVLQFRYQWHAQDWQEEYLALLETFDRLQRKWLVGAHSDVDYKNRVGGLWLASVTRFVESRGDGEWDTVPLNLRKKVNEAGELLDLPPVEWPVILLIPNNVPNGIIVPVEHEKNGRPV